MYRIFISHSGANNVEARALFNWIKKEGWGEAFFDIDREQGIKAGEKWRQALKRAGENCEFVIFVISPAWAQSPWCLAEFNTADQLGKRIFAVVIEPTPHDELPSELTAEWQMADLVSPERDVEIEVEGRPGEAPVIIRFSREGLGRLRNGLQSAGIDAPTFNWPPPEDKDRSPFPGLRPLDVQDAAVFFGRHETIKEAMELLHRLRDSEGHRMLVIQGASGAGKSSFLRAGLLARIKREPRYFLPLQVIRPLGAALTGKEGLAASIEQTVVEIERERKCAIGVDLGDIRQEIENGARGLKELLAKLARAAALPTLMPGGRPSPPPTIVLPIDQLEELFTTEGQGEAGKFAAILAGLIDDPTSPSILAVVTVRSDKADQLQEGALAKIRPTFFSLVKLPSEAYKEVIQGPCAVLAKAGSALQIDPELVEKLRKDMTKDGAKDALPLLSFTLERLFLKFGKSGRLTVQDYESLGGIEGSIKAAMDSALEQAGRSGILARLPRARANLLKRALIPGLVRLDLMSNQPRKLVADYNSLPADVRPIIDVLVDGGLLTKDQADKHTTVEPAHEALLRNWSQLKKWLDEDSKLLRSMENINHSAHHWNSLQRRNEYLIHKGTRFKKEVRPLLRRSDLAVGLDPNANDYLAACKDMTILRRWVWAMVTCLLLALGVGVFVAPHQNWLGLGLYQRTETEKRQAGEENKTCGPECPAMVAVELRGDKRLEVGKYEVTFTEWQACANAKGCASRAEDKEQGGGKHPVINVTGEDAIMYVSWLSKKYNASFRLLTADEWNEVAQLANAPAKPKCAQAESVKAGSFEWLWDWVPDGARAAENFLKKLPRVFDREGPTPQAEPAPASREPISVACTVAVEALKPLADVHGFNGNVSEWVSNGSEPPSTALGTSWKSDQSERKNLTSKTKTNDIGFRVARDPPR